MFRQTHIKTELYSNNAYSIITNVKYAAIFYKVIHTFNWFKDKLQL